MRRFEGRIAIITGAGKGIGKATALRLAREGGAVVCVARTGTDVEQTVAEVREFGGEGRPIAADVMVVPEVRRVVEEAREQYGRIDVLVNNVGGSTALANVAASLDEIDLEGWERMLRFNVTSTYLCCQAVAPIMCEQRYGRIVNTASQAGRGRGCFTSSAYAAAKSAVVGFTRRLAMELAPYHVTVNATAPGLTLTERARQALTKQSQLLDQLVALIPLGRGSTPEEQAAAVAFLASGDAAFITGVTLDVSGGFHMQ